LVEVDQIVSLYVLNNMIWYVYMLRCADGTLYSGITTDLKRRLNEHNFDNKKGSKYTKMRRPVELVYKKRCKDRSRAASAEAALKKLTRREKDKLLDF
jgi:putative endonuclease